MTRRQNSHEVGVGARALLHGAARKAEEHVVDRIIGKRPSPQSSGTIEYLVQWRAPYGIRWENQPTLLEKTSNKRSFVLQLIAAYEEQLSQMVNESLGKDTTASPAKLRGRESRRSQSPSRERNKSSSNLSKGASKPQNIDKRDLGRI